jgi:hypothetical protein
MEESIKSAKREFMKKKGNNKCENGDKQKISINLIIHSKVISIV